MRYWWSRIMHSRFCMMCDRALWPWERHHYKRRHPEHLIRWSR